HGKATRINAVVQGVSGKLDFKKWYIIDRYNVPCTNPVHLFDKPKYAQDMLFYLDDSISMQQWIPVVEALHQQLVYE
ncbi:MAG: hypothetical protein NZZ41_07895, partial [Candidatus Dojkabacteria bacterium]|nr:hypothetical protein [Candidatus Dojkabacteria bacterium]